MYTYFRQKKNYRDLRYLLKKKKTPQNLHQALRLEEVIGFPNP